MKGTSRKKKTKVSKSQKRRFFSLDVHIVAGPMTEEFFERNPEVARTVQIRED